MIASQQIEGAAPYIDKGRLMVRFPSVDIQLKSADSLRLALGKEYLVALTLTPNTPAWLRAIGLRPVPLGLDLRGGVHFLFEVDVSTAVKQRLDSYAADFNKMLRENRIRRSISVTGNELLIRLPDAADAKFTIETLDQLGAEFAALAGRDISLGAIAAAESQGLHFVDAGRCHLPGGGTAMHIRFRADGPGAGLVSVWAQVDGTLDLEEGLTYKAGEGCDCVRLWRVGEVRYVMVCSDDQEQPLAEKALACPSQARACGTP